MIASKPMAKGLLALFVVGIFAEACGSDSTNFDSGGGGSSSSGAAGTGATGQGGSTAMGGSGSSGTPSTGGQTGGASGSAPTGGSAGAMGGTPSTGGASGASTGGTSGASTGGSAGEAGSATGGSMAGLGGSAGAGGTAGFGGGVTACIPESDAMDRCGPAGTACLCCPIGGPAQSCICTTQCTTSADCHDAARPTCNIDTRFTQMGICAPDGFICRWGARCAAPNTPIATPRGERPISELAVGDAVYSVEGGAVVVVPIRAVRRQPVTSAHTVSRVTLSGGAVLEISAGHPTADGRLFGDLHEGDELGGLRIERVEANAAYAYPFTHDILPDSSSGAYFAAGALIGSTLAQEE